MVLEGDEMSAITRRQKEVLNHIECFIAEKGYSPTLAEIGKDIGLSTTTIHKHLTNLQRKGFLKRGFHESRSVEMTVPDALNARFRFEGKDRLWDSVAGCYWVKEQA